MRTALYSLIEQRSSLKREFNAAGTDQPERGIGSGSRRTEQGIEHRGPILYLCDAFTGASLEVFSSDCVRVIDGVLRQGPRWYRIEGGVLDLLPASLAHAERPHAFVECYGLPSDGQGDRTAPTTNLQQKSGQIEFFRDDSAGYNSEFPDRSFYMSRVPWLSAFCDTPIAFLALRGSAGGA
jgi:hypothetical protein